MKKSNPLLGIALVLGFLVMSYYLTTQESNLSIIIGYIGLVWWGGLLLFVAFKKFLIKNK